MHEKHVLGHTCHGLDIKVGQKDTEASIPYFLFNDLKSMSFPLMFPSGPIYRPDSFVLMLRYCANLKAIRYESVSLNRIVADKSHRVIVA